MEFIVFALIAIIIILGIKIHRASKREANRNQAHQQTIEQQRLTIDALKRKQISAELQIDKCLNEISNLKSALIESERKLDFYKNIEAASEKLNAADNVVHDGDTQLDPEQSAVCDEIENSCAHFFITGKAGTGKSFLLAAFRRKTHKNYIVLAPTGIAALNVGGATLHSTFGYFNLVNLDVDRISRETIRLKSEKQLVLRRVSTIIIDEISMVRADTFDKIDRILKAINNNDEPFGGKQILLFGDLFQLPPVVLSKEREYLYDRYGGLHFFFADSYRQANFHFRELTINHRQKEDAIYFELLNRVRDGSVTSEDIKTLNTRIVHDFSVYDRFTTLLPTKAEVEQLNQYHIRQLDSKEYTYHASIIKDKYPDKKHSFEAIFPIANTLCLKKGVLVMMVSNDPEHRWVNGTLGIVSDLSDSSITVAINRHIYDIQPVEFSEQEVSYKDGELIYEDVLTVTQYPIIPAYAITIHKSQGQTYQNIVCDIDKCFADGQAYVALSRCTSLSGLHLTQQISRASMRVDRSVLDYYHECTTQSAKSIP